MTQESAVVHVTKLAAADRQLRAAVRMFFLEEDDLAVHTIAAAAYRLISDLKNKRGLDEVADYYKYTIFYAVRDYHREALPGYLSENPEAMAWIAEMADQLPITSDTAYEDFSTTVSEDTVRDYWAKRNFTANFLKHADRDHRSTLSTDGLDNLQLLLQAVAGFGDLVRDGLDPEGQVIWLYNCVTHDLVEDLSGSWRLMADKLTKVDAKNRKRFCYDWIQGLGRQS